MSTRLQLCQRLAKEAGIVGASNGTLPASTSAQSGEMLSVVTWIDDAYENIQSLHTDWLFLRFGFTFPTVIGTAAYIPTAAAPGCALTEFQDWQNASDDDAFTCYLTATGTTDEQAMQFVPWDEYKNTYGFAAMRTQVGRPYLYTIKPDKSLLFYPIPDAIYTVDGEYSKRPQRMTADGNEPLFPRQYHLAIMWQALMLYAGFETATTVYAHAQREYDRLIGKLQADQLPAIGWAGSLI